MYPRLRLVRGNVDGRSYEHTSHRTAANTSGTNRRPPTSAPQEVRGEHVGRPPRAMVHDRPARHAYHRRDPGHWVELHGTIEVAPYRRAGRPQCRCASDATIRCIGRTIRNT